MSYENIFSAAREIAYDNDMINTFLPEKKVLNAMFGALMKVYESTQIDELDSWLGEQSAAKLEEVLIGGDYTPPPSEQKYSEMLDIMFECELPRRE